MDVQVKDGLPRGRAVELRDDDAIRAKRRYHGPGQDLHHAHHLAEGVWFNLEKVAAP